MVPASSVTTAVTSVTTAVTSVSSAISSPSESDLLAAGSSTQPAASAVTSLVSLLPIPKKNQGKGTYIATSQLWQYFEEMRALPYMTEKDKEESGLYDMAFADHADFSTNKVPILGIFILIIISLFL